MNCHQNTEAADLLGGLRPLRGRDMLVEELRARSKEFVKRCANASGVSGDAGISVDDSSLGKLLSSLDTLDVAGITHHVQVTRWTQ